MYEKFYGLKEKPFHIVPNPNYFYLSSKHENALTYIEYGVTEEVGFILLTGEIGTGKTTLIRYLLNQIESDFEVAVIFNTKVSPDQLISLILQEYELEDNSVDNKAKKLEILYHYIIKMYAQKRKVLLIIDEAQNLSDESLEEIRMLSNLQTDNRLLIQIMLVGQPLLKRRLKQPKFVQFAQRITVNYHLNAITREETIEYIAHRLRTAGGNPNIFSEAAVNLIYQISNGIPRVVNQLCDTALVYGYGNNLKKIDLETINQVVDDKGDSLSTKEQKEINNSFAKFSNPTNNDIFNRIETIESSIVKLKKDIDELTKMWIDWAKEHNDNSISSLKKFLFEERNRNANLLVENAQLKSENKMFHRSIE